MLRDVFDRHCPSSVKLTHNNTVVINFKFFGANSFTNKLLLVELFAPKNFKINNHQDVSRAFNILNYNNNNTACR